MPTTTPRSLGIVALLLATSGWGGMFLVSKGVLHHVDPFWFTLSRYTIAGSVLIALLLPRGLAPWLKLRDNALPLALRGLAGFGVFSVMLLIGLAHSVPSHGAVIVATAPMTTQLLRWALDGIRPALSNVLTALLALTGVAVVSGVLSGAGSGTSTWHGDAIALVGTIGWILYTRGAATFAQLDVVEYTALTVIASWPLLLAGAFAATLLGWAHAPTVDGLQASWEAQAYVGLVSSTFSVLAFNYGVRALGTVTATAFFNFVPVSALLMSIALGKPPAANELVGMVMVVAALLIHTAISRAGAAKPRPVDTMAAVRTNRPCAVTP